MKAPAVRSVSLALLALLITATSAAPDCAGYAERGYCTDEKYKTYMATNCPDACSAANTEEDEACVNWAAEGYCTNEQFVDYMKRSCPNACGFEPMPAEEPIEDHHHSSSLIITHQT